MCLKAKNWPVDVFFIAANDFGRILIFQHFSKKFEPKWKLL